MASGYPSDDEISTSSEISGIISDYMDDTSILPYQAPSEHMRAAVLLLQWEEDDQYSSTECEVTDFTKTPLYRLKFA